MNNTIAQCAFLTTTPDETIPTKQYADYSGPVPPEVCDYLCRKVISCAKSGRLYPLSPMDAYGDLWLEVESVAMTLPPLASASPTTYLCRAIDNMMKRYLGRKVMPVRAEYRESEAIVADAQESVDTDGLSLCDIAETLPVVDGAEAMRNRAAAELNELIPLLPETVARAFICYIRAEGNMLEAARLARMGKTKFYAKWRCWLRIARCVAEKSGISRH